MSRSKALQIYMKPGIPDDDLMLEIWDAARRMDRPQDVFRAMLRHGLKRMLETGEISEALIQECDLKLPKRMTEKEPVHAAAPAYPYPGGFPPHYAPYPAHVPMPPQAPLQHAPAPSHGYERPAPEAPRETPQRPPESTQRTAPAKPAVAPTTKPAESSSGNGGKKGVIGDLM
jgi:hypothetical protein